MKPPKQITTSSVIVSIVGTVAVITALAFAFAYAIDQEDKPTKGSIECANTQLTFLRGPTIANGLSHEVLGNQLAALCR